MGSFARTRVSFSRGEFPTMGTHHRHRLLIAPIAALISLVAAAPLWAQQGSASGQVDQSVQPRPDTERRLNQEPPQINVQDRPELKVQDGSKVKLKLRAINITGNVS